MQARAAHLAPTRLIHALLYIRVSGAEHQREGLSLDFQKKATRTYVAAHPGWIVAGEYCDIESGSHDDRRQYQSLLAEARRLTKAGHSVAVVVVRLDRFGRDLAEGARARKELRKLGVELHSIKEGGRLHSNMHAGMLMVFGEHERELIIDRVTEVRRSLVEAGWPYGRVAFGYRLRPATSEEINKGLARRLANGGAPQIFEPDPTTSGIAVEVFERVSRGESVGSVSRWLVSLPSELRAGRSWPIQSIVPMLRSPTYVARPAVGVDNVLEREVARWQPLISDELWNAAQERLASHKRRPQQASGRYLLTGFIRCDRCGSRMGATSTDHAVYKCIGLTKGANAPIKGCRRSVSMRRSDAAVLERVAGVLENLAAPENWPAFQRAWTAQMQPDTNEAAKVAQLEREITKLNDRLARAAALLTDGTLDPDGYKALRDREMASIRAAEAEIQRLGASERNIRFSALPSAQAVFDQARGWAEVLRSADVSTQREVLDKLVESVVVARPAPDKYEPIITWSSLGAQLKAATERGARSSN